MKLFFISFFIINIGFCNAQTFDAIGYIDLWGHGRIIEYEYTFEEFDANAYLDSTKIMESFAGTLELTIMNSDIVPISPNTTKYFVTIIKRGTKLLTTYKDTISIENIRIETRDSLFEIHGVNDLGGENYLFGWIFPDTLLESVVDPFDPIPMYPYSRFYRFFNIDRDDSLFTTGDSLFIHYRPKTTNYFDSYFALDYIISKDLFLTDYKKNYWYYGAGFREHLHLKDITIVGVRNPSKNVPTNIYLSQNYPNPFNPITKIRYGIHSKSNVKINIYDALGNKIETLIDKIHVGGEYEIIFDGSKLSSGVYYYRLITNQNIISNKLLLLK